MDDGGGIIGLFIGLIYIAVIVLVVASLWKLFVRAGEPGFAAIIPIWNLIVLLKIAGKPIWWIILFFIPIVNFIALILINIGFAKAFGKDALYGIGLAFLSFIFLPLLAFSDAQYVGPGGEAA